MLFWLIAAIVVWMLGAFLTAVIASSKGRPLSLWFVFGLFFPAISFIGALVIRPTDAVRRERDLEAGFAPCPHCAELSRPEASVCSRCGRPLVVEGQPWTPDDTVWRGLA
jgi:hypothetical protein